MKEIITRIKKILNNKLLIKIIIIFMIIQPVIDIYILYKTEVIAMFGFSPATIIRLIFIFVIGLVGLFSIKFKKKDFWLILYFVIVAIYFIFHHLHCISIETLHPGNFNYNVVGELFYIIRMLIPLCILYVTSKVHITEDQVLNIVRVLITIICGTMVITNFLGIAIASYSGATIDATFFQWFTGIYEKYAFNFVASNGIFAVANRMGALLVLILPLMFYYTIKRPSKFNFMLIFISMLSMLMMGTKIATFGFIIVLIISLLIYLYFVLIKKEFLFNKKIVIYFVIIAALWGIILPFSPATNRNEKNEMLISKEISNPPIEINYIELKENREMLLDFIEKEYINFSVKEHFITKSYSYKYDPEFWLNIMMEPLVKRRDFRFLEEQMLKRVKEINNDVLDDYFGISFTRVGNIFDLERDFLSQYYSLGIFGIVLFLLPYILIIGYCGIMMIYKYKAKFKMLHVFLMFGICFSLFSAYQSGNVMDGLVVTIILSFLIGCLFNFIKNKNNEESNMKLNDKKVTMFSLHLGYGGAEKALSNISKMLENDYELEIISTYKIENTPAFDFSDKVKITYLINDRPYKREMFDAIKQFKLVLAIKYLFKNVQVFILKAIKEPIAIRNINSRYVISTIFHNGLVNDLLDSNYIKIACEHNYCDKPSYLRKYTSNISRFNYLVVVSDEIKGFFEKKLSKADVVTIPNVIDNLPEYNEKIPTNTLISVGRLVSGKGFGDLLDVLVNVKKTLPDIKLFLVGDGNYRFYLEKKVTELDLLNNVIFTGFISQDEINKLYLKSSLFVMTSHSESFGLVLIEAMSNSVPCMAFTSANGACMLLSDKHGLLISDRNKNLMAKEIVRILNHKDKLLELKKTSYEYSKIYYIENVKSTWLNLLNNVTFGNKDIMLDYFSRLYNKGKDDFYTELEQKLLENRKAFIVTANPETYMYGFNDEIMNNLLLDGNTTIVPDGMGLSLGAKILGFKMKEKVTGIDIAQRLLELGNSNKKTLYLYGAKSEVINAMRKVLKEKYPNIKLIAAKDGYNNNDDAIFKEIIKKKPDIVLIALGIPRQEKLIYKYYDQFDKGIFVGVGGSFDVISNKIKRAPKFFRILNIEFAYRILKEPKRFKRFCKNNIGFMFKVLFKALEGK